MSVARVSTSLLRGTIYALNLFGEQSQEYLGCLCQVLMHILGVTGTWSTKIGFTLSLVCSDFYRKLQPFLYDRQLEVWGFRRLSQLARTIAMPATLYHNGVPSAVQKIVPALTINITPDESGPSAVMLSSTICWIVSQCPDIKIQLHIVGKRCDEQPVSSFSTETFPNVVYLRLVVRGPRISHEDLFNRVEDLLRPRLPSDTSSAYDVIPQRRGELTGEFTPLKLCTPRTEFWTSFLDGRTFPQLDQFMLDHCPLEFEWKQEYPAPRIVPQDIPQVRKLRFFLVTGAHELDDSILIAAAPLFRNLTTLCLSKLHQVTYTGLSFLLRYPLPALVYFSLSVPVTHEPAHHADRCLWDPACSPAQPHLCPLLRRFCAKVKTVNIALPFACERFFLSEANCEIVRRTARIMENDARGPWTYRAVVQAFVKAFTCFSGKWEGPVLGKGERSWGALNITETTCAAGVELSSGLLAAASVYTGRRWVLLVDEPEGSAGTLLVMEPRKGGSVTEYAWTERFRILNECLHREVLA